MYPPSFLPFQNLESDRLLLRQLNSNDIDDVFAIRSNPNLMKYIPRPLLQTKNEALDLINLMNQKIIDNQAINWAIIEKNSQKFVGFLGHYRIQWENYRSEIGYMVLEEFKGNGYTTEAVKLICEYGFKHMQMHSLEGVIDPENIASARVLEKNGFVKEGHYLENEYFDGKFWDSTVYSLLKRNFTP